MSNPTFTACILVVDDEPDIRELLILVLQARGYRVLDAENGLRAVEIAVHNDVQLAILDIKMPLMDGIVAATTIRKAKPRLKLIFHTSMEETYLRGRFAADATYLGKPAEATRIVDTVGRLLQ